MKLTSNQRYAGLNRRFDRRATQLFKAGFHYERIESLGFAIFTKKIDFQRAKQTIPAQTLLYASKFDWTQVLATHLKRGLRTL